MRTRITGRVPPVRQSCPGRGRNGSTSVPSDWRTRLVEQREADVALLAAALALVGREALAVVGDDEPRQSRLGPGDVDAHACRPRRTSGRCAAPRARRGRPARRCPRRAPPRRRRAARSRCPSASQRAQQVAERGLQPGRLQARRVDLDEQRAQVPHALAQGRCAPLQHARLARRRRGARASSASGASPKATPARSWTTPSCRSDGDPPALLGRRPRSRGRAAPRARGGRAAGAGPSTRPAGPGRAAGRAGRRAAAARAASAGRPRRR